MRSIVDRSACSARIFYRAWNAFRGSVWLLDILEEVVTEAAFIIKIDLCSKCLKLRNPRRRWTCCPRRAGNDGAGNDGPHVCRHNHFAIGAPESAKEAGGALRFLLGNNTDIAAASRSAVLHVMIMVTTISYG